MKSLPLYRRLPFTPISSTDGFSVHVFKDRKEKLINKFYFSQFNDWSLCNELELVNGAAPASGSGSPREGENQLHLITTALKVPVDYLLFLLPRAETLLWTFGETWCRDGHV